MNTLWKTHAKNFLISLGLYAILFVVLLVMQEYAHFDNLLRFGDVDFLVGIPASIFGVAYILTIRDPQNYTGFYSGIIMSLLLAAQFYFQGQYDSTILYDVIFILFQIMSIITWKRSSKQKESTDDAFEPAFLEWKPMILANLCFLLITVGDYFLATYWFNPDGAGMINVLNALLISSSVLANYLLIFKKTDSWIYWLVYSAAGIVLFALVHNVFSIVLFIFFLIINGSAAITWFKITEKENMGWLKFLSKSK